MGQTEGLKFNPIVVLYVLNTVVALAVSFGLPLSHSMVQAVATIATAVLTFSAAVVTRPVTLSICAAAATTALTAAAAFGLHLTSDQIGEFVGLLSLVIAFVTHQTVIPVSKLAPDVSR
jgi:hypothetical protein